MTLLLVDLLLLLSLLSVRPAASLDRRIRPVLHALLLAVCLVVSALQPAQAALSGRANPGPALVGAVAALLEAGLVWRWLPAGPRSGPVGGGAGWLLAGLALAALSLRLLPAGVLPVLPHAELAASLGIVLTGLLGAVAAQGGDGSDRIGALLLGGHGLVLAACVLPGLGWQPLPCVLLLQAWLVGTLVWQRVAGPAAP